MTGGHFITEVRSAEAGDFLTALNTGHSGSLGSAHANSAEDMISRLEMMVLMGMDLPIPVIRRQIAGGIEILVHLERDRQGRRRVCNVVEILGMSPDGDRVEMHDLFRRDTGGQLVMCDPLRHQEKWERAYGRS